MGRIDVHHHFFPADLNKETSNQKMGWRTPVGTLPWTPDVSIKAMDTSGIDLAILSLPAMFAGSVSEENRGITRERNIYASRIVQAHPNRFGFFASLPFLDDVEGMCSLYADKKCDYQDISKGALVEIAYAMDVLKADGIALSSSYGVGAFASKTCVSHISSPALNIINF
jgi:hypothetical protein